MCGVLGISNRTHAFVKSQQYPPRHLISFQLRVAMCLINDFLSWHSDDVVYSLSSGGTMAVCRGGKPGAFSKILGVAMVPFWSEPAKVTMENLPSLSCKCMYLQYLARIQKLLC